MVANDGSRGTGSDDDMPMTSLGHDVMTGHSVTVTNLECPHCDFCFNSPALMTQHSWEQHPLLMRRKKHLITSSKMNFPTSSISEETIQRSNSSPMEKSPPPFKQTAQQVENCPSSGENMRMGSSEQSVDAAARTAYRNNAMRSLSLLSTAAAILEQQPQQPPQRHIAVVKPQPSEHQRSQHQFLQFPEHPIYTPMYNAYIPSLNQYVAIPIHVVPGMPNPAILNANLGNAMRACLHTQPPPNAQYAQPISFSPPQYPTPPTVVPQNAPKPVRQTSDVIRTLLQTKVPVRQLAPQSKSNSVSHVTKLPRFQPHETRPPSQHPTLEKDRLQALEKAILSMDCCDINDTSTTMPFECADGVWRMVSFKCIRGLWVVQTPESSTPTVYVPCDEDDMAKTSSLGLRKAGRSMSEGSGCKRKLSNNITHELLVEAKRSCASAPVLNLKTENYTDGSESPLKRTLSNPLITNSLPPPSQQFTNNQGKRINISMIKRNNSAQTSSCSLIKSLLLRKPVHTVSNMTSQVQNMTSQVQNTTSQIGRNKMQCKPASGRQLAGTLNLPPVALSNNSMVY